VLEASKIRLHPNPSQEPIFVVPFGGTRFVWHKALEIKKAACDETRIASLLYTIKSMLPVWKGEFSRRKNGDS